MEKFSYTITAADGLNAKNAGQLIKEILNYSSSIKILKGQKTADARIIFNVLSLNISENDTIEFLLSGQKEKDESITLEAYMRSHF